MFSVPQEIQGYYDLQEKPVNGRPFYQHEANNLQHIKECKNEQKWFIYPHVSDLIIFLQEKYKKLLSNLDKFFCIKIIERLDRQVDGYAELRDFTDDNRLLLVSERRPCLMRFLELTPKSKM